MKVIKRICDTIDLVNDWIGRIASFAVLGILAGDLHLSRMKSR